MHRGKVQFQSENLPWHSWTSLQFYSLDPGSKLDWYKRCHCRAKSSFSVQNSSSGKSVVSKFSFYLLAFPNYFHFFSPPVPFYSSPLSTFPFLLVSQWHGCKKHIYCWVTETSESSSDCSKDIPQCNEVRWPFTREVHRLPERCQRPHPGSCEWVEDLRCDRNNKDSAENGTWSSLQVSAPQWVHYRQFWWWFAWSHPECWRRWHFPWVSTWYIDWWSATNNIILFWAHGTITHWSHSSNMKCKEASPHDAIRFFQTSSAIDDPPHHHNKRTMISMHQTRWAKP